MEAQLLVPLAVLLPVRTCDRLVLVVLLVLDLVRPNHPFHPQPPHVQQFHHLAY
jgi:hypothetical protein